MLDLVQTKGAEDIILCAVSLTLMFVLFFPTMMFPVVAESETVQHFLLQPGLHFQRDKTSTKPLIKVIFDGMGRYKKQTTLR